MVVVLGGDEHGDEMMAVGEEYLLDRLGACVRVCGGVLFGHFPFFLLFWSDRNEWLDSSDGWMEPAGPMTDMWNLFCTAFRSVLLIHPPWRTSSSYI